MRGQRQNRTRLQLETLEDRFTPAIGYHGGIVVANVQVVALYSGSYWSTSAGMQSAAQINTFLSYIVESPFMDTMNQYGAARGTTLGVGVIDPGLLGAVNVTDAGIQAELAGDIAAARLPGASIDTLYIVFTPPNVTVSDGSETSVNGFLGYHNIFAYGPTGVVNYAVIASPVGNGTYDSLTDFQTITHSVTEELAEAVTDPDHNGWIDSTTGDEIGSEVNQPGNIAILNNYVVAGLWSAVQQAAAYPVGSTPPIYNPSPDTIIAADVQAPVASDFTHTLEYYDGLVDTYYENFLGRAAGQSELNYWALNLNAGNRNEEVLSQILGSNEFFQKAGGTNEDWLNQLYKDLLGRTPDKAGEAAWLKALPSGSTRQQVASLVDSSSEREAVVVGSYYQSYLGRTAAGSEVNYWVGALENGATQEQVLTAILSSSEFLTHEGGTLSGWLTGVYEATLKRTPDTAGFDSWIRVLNVPFAD
ncbi:MAG TPA: DUF4214 domain-containing protein [Gemmataceae bacterium]|nr:DUF4214 domain-containing protein [Gemmataceae bacterium]